MNDINKIIIGRKELASIFGVADKYINELVNLQKMPQLEHNQYNLVECFQWFISYKNLCNKKAIEKAKSLKPSELLAEKNATLKQFEIDIQEGSLISTTLVEKIMSNEAEIYILSLDSVLADYRIKTKGESDYNKLNEILIEIVNSVKTKLANTVPNIR